MLMTAGAARRRRNDTRAALLAHPNFVLEMLSGECGHGRTFVRCLLAQAGWTPVQFFEAVEEEAVSRETS